MNEVKTGDPLYMIECPDEGNKPVPFWNRLEAIK